MPPQDENITKANIEAPTKIPVVLDIMVFVLNGVNLVERQIYEFKVRYKGNFKRRINRIFDGSCVIIPPGKT